MKINRFESFNENVSQEPIIDFDNVEVGNVRAYTECDLTIPFKIGSETFNVEVLQSADVVFGEYNVQIIELNGAPEFELTQQMIDDINDIVLERGEVG